MAARTLNPESQTSSLAVVNFYHPLEESHLAQIVAITGHDVIRVVDVPATIRQDEPLVPQAIALVQSVPFSPREWQTRPIVVNLPGLAPLAAVVLAELHGRMGHFPALLRLRPETHASVTRYVVAEIINLQELRDAARARRIPQSATDPMKQPPNQGKDDAE